MDSRQQQALNQMKLLAKSMENINGVFDAQYRALNNLDLPEGSEFHKMAGKIQQAVKSNDVNAIKEVMNSAAASLK